MQEYVIGNIILILCIGGLGSLLFTDDVEDRVMAFVAFAWAATVCSFIGWGLFIAHHFLVRYW